VITLTVRDNVAVQDYLTLTHNLGRADLTFKAQFLKNGYLYDYTDYATYFADDVPDVRWAGGSFTSNNSLYVSAVRLANGNVFIAYNDQTATDGMFTVLGPEGDVVKSPTQFNTSSSQNISATVLLTGSVLVAYRDTGNSNYGTFKIISADGSTVSSAVVFSGTNAVGEISAVTLPNNNAMITYVDLTDSSRGKLVVYNSSGIVQVTPQTVETDTTWDICAATLTNGHVFIAYRDNGNSNYGTLAAYSYIGGSLTQQIAPTVFSSELTQTSSVVALDNGNALIAFTNSSNYPSFAILNSAGAKVADTNSVAMSSSTMDLGYVNKLANGDVFFTYYTTTRGYFAVYSQDGYRLSGPANLTSAAASNICPVPLASGNVLVPYVQSSQGQYAIYTKPHLSIQKSSNNQAILYNFTDEDLECILSVDR
jgi:hypothetical protein